MNIQIQSHYLLFYRFLYVLYNNIRQKIFLCRWLFFRKMFNKANKKWNRRFWCRWNHWKWKWETQSLIKSFWIWIRKFWSSGHIRWVTELSVCVGTGHITVSLIGFQLNPSSHGDNKVVWGYMVTWHHLIVSTRRPLIVTTLSLLCNHQWEQPRT